MRQAFLLAAFLALTASRAAGHGTDTPPSLAQTPRADTAGEANSKLASRAQRLAHAESLLAAGHAAQARDAFEQAAQQEHAADIELGILRSKMQAGDYRGALAFAAHTAGAHPDVGAGAAFYAWLLYLSGQQTIALKTLARAEQRLPADAALARVRSLLRRLDGSAGNGDRHAAAQEPLASYERLAPYAFGSVVPANAKVVGGAVLLQGGKHAIAPLQELAESQDLWLRNGLGHTVRASVRRRDTATGLALLDLDEALEDPDTQLAPRDAFPGSGAYVFGYLPGSGQEAAWPFTGIGFLGMPSASNAPRPLGYSLPVGTQGAPVVDLQGSLVGLVLPSGEGSKPVLGGVGTIRALADLSSATTTSGKVNRPLAEIYEQALRMALQVIVLAPN